MITVFIRSIILYIALLISLRIMGKGEIAEMNSFDLVITFLLAEVASIPMENNNIPVIEKAQTELDLLIESGNAKGTALVGGLQKRLQSAVVTLLLLGIITVAVSIIFGIYITHSITRPVGQLKRAAHNLVEGRLSAD